MMNGAARLGFRFKYLVPGTYWHLQTTQTLFVSTSYMDTDLAGNLYNGAQLSGSTGGLVSKRNPKGHHIWSVLLTTSGTTAVSATFVLDKSLGYSYIGLSSNTLSGVNTAGTETPNITKFDSNGNVVWNYVFGAGSTGYLALDSVIDNSGNLIVAVASTSTTGILLKLSSSGSIVWQQQVLFSGWVKLGADAYGNIYLCTSPTNTPYKTYVYKVSAAGTVLWSKVRSTYGRTLQTLVTPTGDVYAFCSLSASLNLVKFDTNGNFQWELQSPNSTYYSYGAGRLDSGGNLVLTASYTTGNTAESMVVFSVGPSGTLLYNYALRISVGTGLYAYALALNSSDEPMVWFIWLNTANTSHLVQLPGANGLKVHNSTNQLYTGTDSLLGFQSIANVWADASLASTSGNYLTRGTSVFSTSAVSPVETYEFLNP